LSAIVPALQALGHEVIALPTILLSNHPGHTHAAGERIAPDLLARMLDALDANGWLGEVEGVLTGYLPSEAHVRFAADMVDGMRRANPGLLYLCDPILGDDPKGLYIEQTAAECIRDTLLARAVVATPNRFELAFLTGKDITSHQDAARALGAAEPGAAPFTIATSLPGASAAEMVNLAACGGLPLALARVPRRPSVPQGTGDLMSAFVLAALVEGRELIDALALASTALDVIIAASAGRDELSLSALPRRLADIEPWGIETLEAPAGGRGSGWTLRPRSAP
jgi:pyridoxine kinase